MRPLGKFFLWLVIGALASVVIFESFPRFRYVMADERLAAIGRWIFVDKTTALDTAFVGTSRTVNGVDTPFLTEQRPDRPSLNLAIPVLGSDAREILVRDLLRHRPPRRLVVEMAPPGDLEKEHPAFPYLAGVGDLKRARDAGPGRAPASSAWLAGRAIGWRRHLERLASLGLPFAVKGLHGPIKALFASTVEDFAATRGFLGMPGTWAFPDPSVKVAVAGDGDGARPAPEHYRRLAGWAKASGTEVFFLFVPARNELLPSPGTLALFRDLGEPVVLGVRELYAAGNWADEVHVNRQGARLFSRMLLESVVYR